MPHSDNAIPASATMTDAVTTNPEGLTMTNEELSLLIDWMADQPRYTKHDLAYAVEKPHKYTVELAAAQHENDSQDGMHCVSVNYSPGQPVTADCDDCNWTVGDEQ